MKTLFKSKYFYIIISCILVCFIANRTPEAIIQGIVLGLLIFIPVGIHDSNVKRSNEQEAKKQTEIIKAKQVQADKEKAENERFMALTPEEQQVELQKRQNQQQFEFQKRQLQLQKEQIEVQKQNLYETQAHENALMHCLRCGSTSISSNKKGYGVVKGALAAVVGGAVAGPVGLVGLGAGNIGRNKVVCTCTKCGYKWKAGKK